MNMLDIICSLVDSSELSTRGTSTTSIEVRRDVDRSPDRPISMRQESTNARHNKTIGAHETKMIEMNIKALH